PAAYTRSTRSGSWTLRPASSVNSRVADTAPQEARQRAAKAARRTRIRTELGTDGSGFQLGMDRAGIVRPIARQRRHVLAELLGAQEREHALQGGRFDLRGAAREVVALPAHRHESEAIVLRGRLHAEPNVYLVARDERGYRGVRELLVVVAAHACAIERFSGDQELQQGARAGPALAIHHAHVLPGEVGNGVDGLRIAGANDEALRARRERDQPVVFHRQALGVAARHQLTHAAF